MSYVTYTTKALVCGSFERNTSDKSFLLFTREAGMLFAAARSVRVEKSKQRSALQDFSRIRVSLLKGKHGWRVGSVEAEQNDYSLAHDRASRGSVVLIYRLLRRFIRGEEAFPELYDFSVSALDTVLQVNPNRRLLDLFIQIRILAMLGYVDKAVIPEPLRDQTLAKITSMDNENFVPSLEKIVAKATEISHL